MASATITFTAPVNNGGAAIIDYTATSTPGGFTVTGAASPLTVTGLAPETEYTFVVTARNSVGSSVASAPSPAITTAALPPAATVPDAPTNVVATEV